MIDDAVMQALFYPAKEGFLLLPPAGRVLLANGVSDPALESLDPDRLNFRQWWKGEADTLLAQGYSVSPDAPEGPFAIAMIRTPRQREEGLALLAESWRDLAPGGIMIAAAANDAGGGRLEKDLLSWIPSLQSAAKHRCRIAWAIKDAVTSPPPSWHENGAMRRHERTGVWTKPGLFSWDRIDPATALLRQYLPEQETGSFADFGCGYGAIALEILRRNPGCRSLTCIDADARALEACRRNIEERFPENKAEYRWQDLSQPAPGFKVDRIIMNPPFHRDKAESFALGQSFIARAKESLNPGGSLLMVANTHLPYEDRLRQLFKRIEKCHQAQGFKIYRACLSN
ncbi:MAG TPA: class I SAM-dependent methyltransferase [Micavibrio sp.]|jgi:16S rRNA (guanine1207-N2)-methyltransferase